MPENKTLRERFYELWKSNAFLNTADYADRDKIFSFFEAESERVRGEERDKIKSWAESEAGAAVDFHYYASVVSLNELISFLSNDKGNE